MKNYTSFNLIFRVKLIKIQLNYEIYIKKIRKRQIILLSNLLNLVFLFYFIKGVEKPLMDLKRARAIFAGDFMKIEREDINGKSLIFVM